MKTFFKWLGIVLGAIVVLILAVFGYASLKFSSAQSKVYDIGAIKAVYVPEDSATVARGKHLVFHIAMCVECHGQDLGGNIVLDDAAIGTLAGPNITTGKGGKGEHYQDVKAFDKVVRHGIKHDGTGVYIMSSQDYWRFSNEDLAAIFAYVKSVPPVDREMPKVKMGPVGKMLFLGGIMPPFIPELINHTAVRPATPAYGPTKEYGEHLAHITCVGCHHENMAGGPIPGAPPDWPLAANITKGGAIATYTEQDFFNALRDGIRPGGNKLNEIMPYRWSKGMTDDEIHALWAYVQSIPAAPTNVK